MEIISVEEAKKRPRGKRNASRKTGAGGFVS